MTPRQGPAELLRSLPAALGRRPAAGEWVLIGWNDAVTHLADAITIPPDALPHDHVAAVRQLADDGATRCAVVAYTGPDGAPEPWVRWLIAAADAYGLTVHDALVVTRTPTGAAWRSVDCNNPRCCPPEGTPLTEGEPL